MVIYGITMMVPLLILLVSSWCMLIDLIVPMGPWILKLKCDQVRVPQPTVLLQAAKEIIWSSSQLVMVPWPWKHALTLMATPTVAL